MFACDNEEVRPDFMTLGKGLTGGYLPMAATLTTNKIWSTFLGDAASQRALYHGHTYSGNPLSAAVALASLDLFETEQVFEQLPKKIEHLGNRLAAIAQHPNVTHARQRGMIVAFDLVSDRESGAPFAADHLVGQRLASTALKQGVWLRPRPDMCYAIPPLAISHDEIDFLMDAIVVGLEEATGTRL